MEATSAIDPNLLRTQKQIDAMKTQKNKLAEENARLKQQVAEMKASHSRIRRIPKKPAAAVAQEGDEAPATA